MRGLLYTKKYIALRTTPMLTNPAWAQGGGVAAAAEDNSGAMGYGAIPTHRAQSQFPGHK
jgi:hypothetical protein